MTRASHVEGVGARRGSHADGIGVVFGSTFNTIAWGQECIEALNESRVTIKQSRDALDHTRRINATESQKVSWIVRNRILTLGS